jgi:hypothetical protein
MHRTTCFLLIAVAIISAQETGGRYLIITEDTFYDAVLPFAEWKHKTGMSTVLKKKSEAGGSSAGIRNYISNAYFNWDIRPEYLLIVGAPNYIPFGYVGGEYSDNYYTDMEGDFRNDILSGRLTAHNPTEAQTVINKILLYERTPHMDDSLWFKKACLIVRSAYYDPYSDSIYWSDLRYAAGLMVANGFIEIDSLCSDSGHTATDIVNATNEGRSIIQYRGVGYNNWYTPFAVNPDGLANGPRLPVVLSTTCQTLGTGSTPAAAERWFLTGTPTTPRGASAYFATTTVVSGQAYLRSAVAKGFQRGLFVDDKTTFGRACESGRENVYTLHPYQGGLQEYFGFTTIGDPDMQIWTDTPCQLSVTHPTFVPALAHVCSVHVARADNNTPIRNAFVCIMGLYDSTVYALDTTDITGNAMLIINPQIVQDTLFVTVTGHNLYPYEGWMLSRYAESYVIYQKSIVDDTAGGNADGVINPGETINLPLWVENLGDSVAQNIIGTLTTIDTLVTILDSVKQFGDVAGHDSAFTGPDGYSFTVSPACPNDHTIRFDLVCVDNNETSFASSFTHQVWSADLVFEDIIFTGGNSNNTIEPAETVSVEVALQNQGGAAINDASALLYTSSSLLELIDPAGYYEHVGIDSSASNPGDPFIIAAQGNAPFGTLVDLHMIITAGYYCDTIDFFVMIGAYDYYVWNPDLTPGSGEQINSLLTALGYWGDCGTALTADLQPYRTVFACVGVSPNNYTIPATSPEALQLADFLTSGGRLYLEGGDVWYHDPLNGGFDFSSLFGITATDDGSNNMGPVIGQTGTFTEGMTFVYEGENQSMDHISPQPLGPLLIFQDENDGFDCGVAYDAGLYRTIGCSFELGMLNDESQPSTRATLLDSIMRFFGFASEIQDFSPLSDTRHMRISVQPNPCRQTAHITIDRMNVTQGIITIRDITGRLVAQYDVPTRYSSPVMDIIWHGTDQSGKRVPDGVYFIQMKTPDRTLSEKIILLH